MTEGGTKVRTVTSITKKFDFCYGHRLPGYHGKCREIHGHNAIVEVEVDGHANPFADPYAGMIMDFGDLKNIVKPIIDTLDHKMLNEVLPEKYLPPTCEHITNWLYQKIDAEIPGGVVRVKVTETPSSWAEVRRV